MKNTKPFSTIHLDIVPYHLMASIDIYKGPKGDYVTSFNRIMMMESKFSDIYHKLERMFLISGLTVHQKEFDILGLDKKKIDDGECWYIHMKNDKQLKRFYDIMKMVFKDNMAIANLDPIPEDDAYLIRPYKNEKQK